jgi:tetratricopeptide (TPR) repeat protein
MQRRGVNMMLDSGVVEPEKLGVYSFLAGQLAYQAEDWAEARKRVQEAIAAGYTENEPQIVIAESYFNEDNYAAGLDVLDKAIAARVAAGQTVPDNWIKRGLAMAYEGNLAPQSTKFARMYVEYYPTVDSWGDAIAIQRTFFEADGNDTLDLMRLAQRTNSLRTERDYVDYINAADARRLPGEVARVIDAGLAAGKLRSSDVFVSENKSVANGRIAADKSDLPGLERDARAASASAVTASAAGDAFLSYQQPAKAEEFYKIALTKPGVDTSRVLTRLGIAQVDQGKFAEAQETFAKVEGSRKEIATLWSIYAKQQAKQ